MGQEVFCAEASIGAGAEARAVNNGLCALFLR